ncbi:MAG: FkbM family methyltransferase [bacterium]|nr:FkbM family methyltransferase [bacterium]
MSFLDFLIVKTIFLVNATFSFGKREIGPGIYSIDKKTKLNLRRGTADMFVVWEVFRQRSYEKKPSFKIFPGDVVVDVGAHVGVFSVWAAQKAHQGRVYAYEPNPENYRYLENNKKLNKLDNLSMYNLAVGRQKGELNLYLSSYNTGGHSLYRVPGDEKAKSLMVKTVDLAEIFSSNKMERINFLKIDAEGAEYEIILNAPIDLLRRIDRIALEYHDYLFQNHSYLELKNFLENNGFKVKVGGSFFDRKIFKLGLLYAQKQD